MQLKGFSQLEKIAEGGMAILYRGIQTSLNRPVAIKVLKAALTSTPEAREMFEWESKIVARLDHPHIIRVIDKGLTEDKQPFFVMDYIEGDTLKDALRSGSLPDRRKLRVVIQVAKALSYAHKNGIIHRDIKPGNILIDKEGNARVVDFGIARILSEDTEIKQHSEEGLTIGTLAYMAPEQHQSAHLTTEFSDIYSLGVIMYLMFANQLPKTGFPPPSHFNPKIPGALDNIIMKCLNESQAMRPSADQLIAMLLKTAKGAHLKQEQKQQAKESFKDPKDKFRLLDIIKDTPFSTVSLYENREDHSLMVLKKTVGDFNGHSQAELLSHLKHRNIVNIRGVTGNDRIFIIVMEYLSGGSLQGRLAQAMPIGQFLTIAYQICDAMSFAHNNRIIHGNLRPQNILFDEHNQAKVMDFGFRRHYEASEEPNWYALPDEEPGMAGDVFAAGVIFYQMLTAQLPEWEADGRRLAACPPFDELPDYLQQLLGIMLQRDPNARISNFDDVKQALIDGQPKDEEPSTTFKADTHIEQPPAKRKSAKGLLVLLLLLFIAANTALFMGFNGKPIDAIDWDYWIAQWNALTGAQETAEHASPNGQRPVHVDDWEPQRRFEQPEREEDEQLFNP